VLRADGVSRDETLGLIERHELWDAVSSSEKTFLVSASTDGDECRQLVWRLESIWVLLWALGQTDQLDWPSKQCDVSELVELLKNFMAEPGPLTASELRPISEILDAQDLILRIHWAIRDAFLNQASMIPEDLDWSGKSEMVPLTHCGGVGVVEERHHALNWLANVMNSTEWDGVDTPT
jgi:hypothetical protein